MFRGSRVLRDLRALMASRDLRVEYFDAEISIFATALNDLTDKHHKQIDIPT